MKVRSFLNFTEKCDVRCALRVIIISLLLYLLSLRYLVIVTVSYSHYQTKFTKFGMMR